MFTALGISAVTVTLEGSEVAIVPFAVVLVIGLIIVLPLALFRRWYFYRRRLRKNVITAQYDPPLDLNPAEIGYLFDGKLKEREVGATIIHLIQRGFLHIKKAEGTKRIFAGPQVSDKLKVYENKLVMEADEQDGVTGDELLHRFSSVKIANTEVSHASKPFVFTQLVHADLEKHGYVRKSSMRRFLTSSLKITLFLLFVVFLLPLLFLWSLSVLYNGATDYEALGAIFLFAVASSIIFFIPLYIAGMILNIVRGKVVGREWIITSRLERLWPQIVGYRQYVQMVEREKLEFQTKQMAEVSKNDTLPYAVALGFVKNWKKIIS